MAQTGFNTSLGSVVLQVSTELMQSTAADVLNKAEGLKEKLTGIIEISQKTSSYWEGETAENERAKLKAQNDSIEEIVNTLKAFVTELQLMGENYEQAETASTEEADRLPTDIIN